MEREALNCAVMDIVQRDSVTLEVNVIAALNVADDICVTDPNVRVKEEANETDLLLLGVLEFRRRVWEACRTLHVLDAVGSSSSV